MNLADFVQATFWGAVIIFALISFYCWFIAQPKQILVGFGAFCFRSFISLLGLKMRS